MNAELFYLVGKPNELKQKIVCQLKEELANDMSILIPNIYTTDKEISEGDSYIYVDECDFLLRQSMGMYCLNWKKNEYHYGVVAELIQRLNTGVDAIVNGSLHNLAQAIKQFPNLNTVLIKKQGNQKSELPEKYLIAEDDEVKLEWNDAEDMGHPYVLTLTSEKNIPKAIEMLLCLINYEKTYINKTG